MTTKIRNSASLGPLLRERLRSLLPVAQIAIESLQQSLARVHQEMQPLAGVPLGELLLNPRTDVAALVMLKNHLKRQAIGLPQRGPEHETVLALYFAAIASAWVYHRQRISSHSDATLTRSFGLLKDQSWMAWELAELFSKAILGLARPVGK